MPGTDTETLAGFGLRMDPEQSLLRKRRLGLVESYRCSSESFAKTGIYLVERLIEQALATDSGSRDQKIKEEPYRETLRLTSR